MKVLIVEDEVAAARRLIKMLGSLESDISILATTDSISTTVDWLSANPEPEMIFMDIHLADGSSFKIFEKIRVTCPIIFTTAYDQYAIQAFKVNSIDYLLKPIKADDLRFSLRKYNESRSTVRGLDVEALIKELKKPKTNYQQRFIVQFADKIKAVEVENIAYFMAMDKGVYIVTFEDQHYSIDYTLEKLEGVLNPKSFFRVNRKFLISFRTIKNMYSYSKSRIKLDITPCPATEVIVTYDRTAGFKEWLNQ